MLSWTSHSPFNESESEPTSTHTHNLCLFSTCLVDHFQIAKEVKGTTYEGSDCTLKDIAGWSMPVMNIYSWLITISSNLLVTILFVIVGHNNQYTIMLVSHIDQLVGTQPVSRVQTIYLGFEIIIIQEDLHREVAYSRLTLFPMVYTPPRICCIGAGYVGGPTMATIALKCPQLQVRWFTSRLHQVLWALLKSSQVYFVQYIYML